MRKRTRIHLVGINPLEVQEYAQILAEEASCGAWLKVTLADGGVRYLNPRFVERLQVLA